MKAVHARQAPRPVVVGDESYRAQGGKQPAAALVINPKAEPLALAHGAQARLHRVCNALEFFVGSESDAFDSYAENWIDGLRCQLIEVRCLLDAAVADFGKARRAR